mgnify:CR=1 FL=1
MDVAGYVPTFWYSPPCEGGVRGGCRERVACYTDPMKRLVLRLIRSLAVRTIRAYKPRVVAVTGSVGKTSTRHAITTAIGSARRVRSTEGNYNNEFGVPLTILGERSPGASLFGSLGVLWRGWWVAMGFEKDYPEVLVMEYGADKPGDILYLTHMARPDVALVTTVGVAHAEFIGTIEDIQEEKGTLVRAVTEGGTVILNADDERVRGMRHMSKAPVVTYGLASADVVPRSVVVETMHDGDVGVGEVVARVTFELEMDGDVAAVTLTNVLGDAHLRAVVAGAVAAAQLGIPLSTIATNLSNYTPMPGRLKLIPGIKHSLLIDDSYNASPESVHTALEVLSSIALTGEAKRIAVLGDMRELGRYSERGHVDVGTHVANLPIDLLVTVGEQARDIARGALAAGMDQSAVFTYGNAADAGTFVQKRLGKGDIVLVKGSQAARTEKVVKELMAEPLRAPELLVRQGAAWQD